MELATDEGWNMWFVVGVHGEEGTRYVMVDALELGAHYKTETVPGVVGDGVLILVLVLKPRPVVRVEVGLVDSGADIVPEVVNLRSP